MIINKTILIVIVIFALVGAADKVCGNKLGLGEKFDEGIKTTGDLILTMLGMMVLAPLLAEWLLPLLMPIYRLVGSDPAMFAGTFLPNDMGGASLARMLTDNEAAAKFSGLIVASMLAPTLIFTIPLGMKILNKEDHPTFFEAISCGLITIPLASFIGGLSAGFGIGEMLLNLSTIIIFVLILLVGIVKFRDMILKVFNVFAKLINVIIMAGLCLAIVQSVLGITLMEKVGDFKEALLIIGQIGLLLAGAFPMMDVLIRVLEKPLNVISKKFAISNAAIGGMVAGLANTIITFKMVETMDEKGKLLAIAFCVSAGFVFGDHLGFTAVFDDTMIVPMLVGKMVGGITAFGMATLYWNKVLVKSH